MIVGGGSISKRPGALSADGQLLFAPVGRLVRIFSAVTGEQVGALQGHNDEVTAVCLNPTDECQVYTSSLDGHLRLFDHQSGECVKTLRVGEPIRSMVVHPSLPVASLAIEWRESASGRVITYQLDKARSGATAMKTRTPSPLVLGGQGGLLATHDKHSLFVWRAGRDMHQPLNLHHTKAYTCVAMSPDESILAAGDVSGRIQVWHNLGGVVPSEKREGLHAGKHRPEVPPPVTTLHWHSGPVTSLCFSPDSTFLLSGGHEGVLVMWQLDGFKQNFLPRLGGPIVGITPHPTDPALYLLRQSDNTLRLVNTATMTLPLSVMGLRPPPRGVALPQAGPATCLSPLGGQLVVPAPNCGLQFFDVQHHRHVALLQVASRNQASLTETPHHPHHAHSPYTRPIEPRVLAVAFSQDGGAMATLDLRPDAGPYGSSEVCLKFWDRSDLSQPDGSKAQWALNTRVDDPHRGVVTSLTYHPTTHMVVTSGGGGSGSGSEPEFRIWVRSALPRRPGSGSGSGARSCWRCRSLGSYRGSALTATAFSPDGSLLAVAAGPRVTLWDPMTNAMAGVLPACSTAESAQQQQLSQQLQPLQGAQGESITRLAFVTGTPYLVGASETRLVVWSLLGSCVVWGSSMQVCSLVADPLHPTFAVALLLPPPPQHQQQLQAAAAGAAPAADAATAGASARGPQEDQQQQQATTSGHHHGHPHRQHPHPHHQQQPRRSHAPQPSCGVLVFSPESPQPLLGARVPGTALAQLLFVAPGMPQHARLAEACSEGCSPLMVVREDRSYGYMAGHGKSTLLLQPEADTLPGAGRDQQGSLAKQLQLAEVSAFEAAFGNLGVGSSSKRGGATAMEVDQDEKDQQDPVQQPGEGARPKWVHLFDAPSHALPPPTALAQAFLTLLTSTEGQ